MEGTPTGAADKRVDLVFEGGGVKGIGLVGAVSVLEERGYQPWNVAGTSAGAIVATLVAAGYQAAELKELMLNLNFNDFKDPTWQNRIPLVGGIASVLMTKGLYTGEYFYQLMRQLLADKGVRTFADLRHPDANGDPRYRYKAQVIASDITGRELLVLPRDANKLGINPDNLIVAEAVRMSMSIPVFFVPVQVKNPGTGREHVIVDGGMLSNFPVWLFDSEGVPAWPTFGLKLVEPDPKTSLAQRLPPEARETGGIHGIVDYARSLVGTMTEFYDRLYLEKDSFVRTITISTLGVRTTEFDLSRERAMQLYDAGRAAAEDFLSSWNFAGYIEEFRNGAEQSRRQEVASEINQPS